MDSEALNKDSSSANSLKKTKWGIRRLFWLGLLFVFIYGSTNYLYEAFFMSSVKIGDRAPEFSVTTQNGDEIRSSDFIGKKSLVVYFYPKDNTSGCTAQACAFRDAYEQFTEAGAEVIGVSGDSPDSHRGFAASQNLPFHLVSDKDGSLRKKFGVPRTFGILPGRVTYVIDREGIVRNVFNSQVNVQQHITESLQVIQELSAFSSSDAPSN